MNWKAHAIIAFLAAIAVFYLLSVSDPLHLLLYGIFASLCALIPDIDLPQSKARGVSDTIVIIIFIMIAYLSFCGWALCLPGLGDILRIALFTFILLGLYFLFMRFIMPRHRGATHSLVACLVFGVLSYLLFGLSFAIAGLVGYLSHLVADGELKFF